MLVLASNWEQLSRPVRAVIAFLPMLAGQGIVGWTLLRRPDSTPLREGGGTFLVLAVAACIALIGQTYHIPGNLAGFLFTWMLLSLPVGYLLRAVLPTMLYMAITVWWAVSAQLEDSHAILFWPLILAALPHLALEWRRGRFGPRAVLLGWALATALIVGTGVALEKNLPGLWTVAYAALFATMYLLGILAQEGWPGIWRRPFYVAGSAGVALLAVLLSFEWPWQSIGWHHYRNDPYYLANAAVADYVTVVTLIAVAVVLLALAVTRGRLGALLYGITPFVAVAAYTLASVTHEALSGLLFSAYLLALGLGTLVVGLRQGRLSTVNGGMFVLSALIVARFFDSEVSFAVRGAAFIVLGLLFLTANLLLVRHNAHRAGGPS